MDYYEKLQMFDGNRWFRFPKDFLKFLSFRESVVLASIINQSCIFKDQMDKNRYFPCSNERIRKDIHIGEKQIKNSLKILSEIGVLKVARRGMPSKRWIRVDVDKILFCITSSGAQKGLTSGAHMGPTAYSPKGEYLYKELCRTSENVRPLDTSNPFFKMASHFAKTIQKIQNMSKPPNVNQWTKDLQRIHTKEGIATLRIGIVMKWYCKQFDRKNNQWESSTSSKFLPPFVPVAMSGRAFRTKFFQIENAMERNSGSEPEPVRLSRVQNRTLSSMRINLGSNFKDARNLDALILKIYEWREKTLHQLKRMRLDASIFSLYERSLFSDLFLFSGYAGWISQETASWNEWKRDMNSFFPGGKNFARYISKRAKERGLSLSKEIWRVINES